MVRTVEELDRLLPEWEALLPRAATHGFYQAPAVVRAALTGRTGDMDPLIVAGRRGGELRFVAPMHVRHMRFAVKLSLMTLGKLPTRSLRFFGDGVVRAREESADACHAALFDALGGAGGFDLCELENVRVPGELWDFFQRGGGGRFALLPMSDRLQKVHQLELAPSFDAYLAAMNPKTRMKFRRRARKFWKDHGEKVELRKITAPADVRAFLDVVNEVYPRSWQGRVVGAAQRNRPSDVEYAEEIARRGWLRAYTLTAAGRPVAFLRGYQYNGTFHHDETGYDQALANEAPGSVLNNLVVEDLHEVDPPAVLDFGFGENEYKRILGNAEHDACAAWVTVPGRWRTVVNLQLGIGRVYERVRSELMKRNLDGPVRDFIKRRKKETDAVEPQNAEVE
jgi:CelD/BcsL family acetyltransferase involved in cellulose biosynthesis